MEDGSDGLPSDPPLPEPMKNGEVMARLQEEGSNDKDDESKLVKVNGSSILEETKSEESDSSDYDALVIDESATSKKELRKPKTTKAGFKGFKNSTNEELDSYMHSNPYFAESIFELFEKSQEKKGEGKLPPEDKKAAVGCNRHKKGKSNPKLREYAQYLGLQPTVQFKCSKCSRAGFQSLASLNYHILRCDDTAPPNGVSGTAPSGPPSTNFRVTRKVFLCSACGTYYENWNLFLHMREVHKRYICLYCLGMFSHPEKLSLHIVSKHNCVPSRINTLEEFYDAHKEPCFLMCCECQKGFTESDNFFQHQCVEVVPKTALKTAVPVKQGNPKNQKNVEHVTADSDKTETDQRNSEEVRKESPADAENVLEERAPPLETTETTQQHSNITNNITCDSSLTQTDSQTALFDDAERMQCNDGAVSFRGSDEDSSGISPEPAEKPSDEEEDEHVERESAEEGVGETRKVPKVTLKFKDFEYLGPPDESRAPPQEEEEENCESDDSEKLTMEVDRIEDEGREDSRGPAREEGPVAENDVAAESQTMQVAGTDVPIVELELEQPLDRFEVKRLLQKCLRMTIATCVYCNHARRISVNGRQLGLHAIAEHRFSAVVNSITAEELIPESFVARISDGLSELDSVHFNLEDGGEDGDDSTIAAFAHVFECFQCRYSTAVHKELYLHNRKMHAKSILLCIMCKSNFYSYSELICHLCPGVYDVERDVRFRCCVCVRGGDELPSAFRLMVHLRKRHNACDVCLEPCHNQAKLSNHVWKHKLHHLCYRCGIAYRNKPDITKHLFWKHGTESVLCKKCLQKKWPHVYHFCILPPSFVCEECNLSFSKAVYLMVHKRLHSDVRPHVCSEEACGERFVSKKLLLKHEFKHREPIEAHHVEPEKPPEQAEPPAEVAENSSVHENADVDAESEKSGERPKAKVDVYDLPELNLSESDSSDSGDEAAPKSAERCVDESGEKPVLETIWDDFRNYRANQDQESTENNPPVNLEAIMGDHDYCVVLEKPEGGKEGQAGGDLQQPDHDYCFGPKKGEADASAAAPAKSSSDSSSDSDSSSCTCGSNCSCSSSSGNNSSSSESSSSDSSSSEGRRRQQARRERRRQKAKTKKKGADENGGNGADVSTNDGRAPPPIGTAIAAVPAPEVPIQESDLETTESDTDEDFYDEQPQKLADKLLAEKKNQLLQVAAIGPYINGSIMDGSRPPTPGGVPAPSSTGGGGGGGSVKKKKSKSKKRKKKSRRDGGSKYESVPKRGGGASPARDFACPTGIGVGPLVGATDGRRDGESRTAAEMDSSLRASKRRRVPNKFYGYSSDEERERVQPPALKWRKVDLPAPVPPRSPLVVPPLTIKTTKPSESAAATAPSETFRPADFHHQHFGRKQFRPPPVAPLARHDRESAATDSNESSSDEEETQAEAVGGPPRPPVPPLSTQPQPALYCYCRCPYDEVSEMIGCDSSDCAIEWFHFECVGIMVPPKGQWFCPDCRKKKQQRREMLHLHGGHAV